MTATVYDRMAAAALRMLKKYGAPGTIARTADNGSTSTAGTPNVVCIGQAKRTFPESAVMVGDDHLLIDAAVSPIAGRDLITYSGGSIGGSGLIVAVFPINPAGTPIAFEVYARAA